MSGNDSANTWRLTLPETWDAYVSLFSKQHRNRIRRTKREMFDRLAQHLGQLADEVERAMNASKAS
jgi:hypothetical protein